LFSARTFLDDESALTALIHLAIDERGNTQTYALSAVRSLATHNFSKDQIGNNREVYLI
jgi:hypothetical protein